MRAGKKEAYWKGTTWKERDLAKKTGERKEDESLLSKSKILSYVIQNPVLRKSPLHEKEPPRERWTGGRKLQKNLGGGGVQTPDFSGG